MIYTVPLLMLLSLAVANGHGDVARCSQPPESGLCLAYFQNYYYNPSTGKCETFIYGGCGGNDNNFQTENACMEACGSVTDNRKRNVDPQVPDVCKLPSDSGPCRAYAEVYHYDVESGQCKMFIYGGCEGNGNRFWSEENCMKTCHPSTEKKAESERLRKRAVRTQVPDMCKLPAETGPCRAYFRNYHYDVESAQCKQFVYGGCRGNANNFRKEEDCIKACLPSIQEKAIREEKAVKLYKQDFCALPPEEGECRALIPRFYFNPGSGKCEKFFYGGCDGNENNFSNEEDCISACVPDSE